MTETWKRIYFGKRNPALSPQSFPQRWKQHAELGGRYPDLLRRHVRVRYCVVRRVLDPAMGPQLQFDGIGLLWLGSPAEMDRPNEDPQVTPIMRRDELAVFQQPVYDAAMVVKETVHLAGPLPGFAVLYFMARRKTASDEDFSAACRSIGRSIATLPEAVKVRRMASGALVRTPTVAFDSVLELWFDSADAAEAAVDNLGLRDLLDSHLAFRVEPLGRAVYLVEVCHERLSGNMPSP